MTNFNRMFLYCFLVLGVSAAHAQPPEVSTVFPPAQSITVATDVEIVVTFDQPIDPSSVTNQSFRVFGRWSGPATGLFQLANNNMELRFVRDRPFSAGEWVTVSLSRGIRAQAGDSLALGYTWNFWTAAAPGKLDLTEIARVPVRQLAEGHVQTYGAYAGDLNGDGFSDLTVVNEISDDIRVFLNDGTGMYDSFTVFQFPGGGVPSTNEGGDFNGDGLIDFAVGTAGSDQVRVAMGDGMGGFSQLASYTAAQSVRGLAIIDLDGDGADDIVTANYNGNNLSLLSNNGNGTFAAAVSLEAGGAGERSCAVADANGDGLQDLFVGTYGSSEVILLLGDGNGSFVFSARVPAGGRPWMMAVGDVDGDGNVDVVSANSSANNLAVVRGDGQGGLFNAVTYPTGGFPLAIDLGDLDGDGDLDMVSSNYSGNDFDIYENDGAGIFGNRRSLPASAAGSCAILHDRDNDGDLDMSGIDELDDLIILFINSCCTSRGNVDNDSLGSVNVADLTFLVDYLFRSGAAPECLDESDIDSDGGTDVADLTYLVDYLFGGGPEPVDCL